VNARHGQPGRPPRAARAATAPRIAASLALLLWAGAAASGCAPASELYVAAAASLREPIEVIAKRFEAAHPGTPARVVFGASSVLALQARAGAPLDVLISADPRIVDALARDGLIAARREIARNRLCVVATPELAAQLHAPRDLASGAVRRLAIPEQAVPVGHYAREWLARQGLLEAVKGRIVQTEHARATLVAVEQGRADAAIVYVTDARLARVAKVAFEIPTAEQPQIAYEAAVLTSARQPAEARAFLAALRAPDAQAVLHAAGFAPPGAAGHADAL
jgi:molybdate transport system substrate-binding protein